MIKNLSEVAVLFNGKTRPFSKGDIPVYGGNGIIDYVEENNANKNTIIIGRVGAYCGNVNISNDKCWVTDNAIGLNVLETCNPWYVYYLLKKENLQKYSGGSGQPLMTQNRLNSLKFTIPNLSEQNNIAEKIKIFDEKLKTNNKFISQLEEYSQLLFHKWFVDFNFPDEHGNPYKDSGGEMVEVDGKMIPKGWDVGNLNDIAYLFSGFSFDSKTYTNEGKYNVITIKNVKDGDVTIKDADKILTFPKKMPKYCKLNSGDILMSLTGNVGRVGLVTSENSLLNQRIAKIMPKENYYYEYLYFLLRNKKSQRLAERYSNGSAQQNLSPIKFFNAPQLIPSVYVEKKFSELTNSIIKKVINLKQENSLLEETRDLLIKKLIK